MPVFILKVIEKRFTDIPGKIACRQFYDKTFKATTLFFCHH